jgi:hypothetical protein
VFVSISAQVYQNDGSARRSQACADALCLAFWSVRDALQPLRHVAKDLALFVRQLVGTQLGDSRDAFQVEERPRRQAAVWFPQLGSHLSLQHSLRLSARLVMQVSVRP